MSRLNHVLHPEILLDRRGPIELRRVLKKLLTGTYYCREGWSMRLGHSQHSQHRSPEGPTHELLSSDFKRGVVNEPGWEHTPHQFTFSAALLEIDSTTRSALAIYKKFLAETPKIYHVQKDFLIALSEVDREIPIQFLPDRFFGYISFAPDTLWDDTGAVQGAYCFIGSAVETPLRADEIAEKVLWIVYTTSDGSTCDLKVELRADKLENLIKAIPKQDSTINLATLQVSGPPGGRDPSRVDRLRHAIYRTVLNAALYIHSQQPNLQREPGIDPQISQTKQREIRAKQTIPNECTVPVTFVNWNFEKPRVYRVGETTVSGHFRWQPCGERRTQVKLIWIEEHLRQYQNLEQGSP